MYFWANILYMLQYASLTGFVRTILIILSIWYGLKILTRLFAPYIMRFVAKKAEQKFGQQFNPQQKPQPKQKEGEISIDKMPNKNTSGNKNVGEYVDYEEID
ncbi:MAG: putative aspartyl protease [Glaciecola sp.]